MSTVKSPDEREGRGGRKEGEEGREKGCDERYKSIGKKGRGAK
jgi:hypothetical protein